MPRGWVVAVLLGLMAVSVFVGTRPMPPAETLQALTRFDPMRGDHLLVWQLRLPRVLLGAVVGAAMGLAAVLMQALTRNPLADPGILGINAGAALAVVGISNQLMAFFIPKSFGVAKACMVPGCC